MEEIIEQVYYEVRNSGFEKKLIGGFVVTGGGAQLKHLSQLFEYITGMDTRIGYPTEYLMKGTDEVTSPASATGVGLVLRGLKNLEFQQKMDKNNGNINQNVHGNVHEVKKDRLNFFERMIGKTKEWLEDEQ